MGVFRNVKGGHCTYIAEIFTLGPVSSVPLMTNISLFVIFSLENGGMAQGPSRCGPGCFPQNSKIGAYFDIHIENAGDMFWGTVFAVRRRATTVIMELIACKQAYMLVNSHT